MNTIANLKPFDKIHLVRKFTGITHTQKIILLVIATHLGSNNSCYVSISTLLSECCLSKRDAITINIKKLIDLGVLFKISPSLGFKSNQYGINFHLLHNKKNYSYPIKKKIGSILRISVYRRDNFTCQKCGISPEIINDPNTPLCIDHIHPESKGGKTDLNNLQTLCRSCNSRKGTKTHQKRSVFI